MAFLGSGILQHATGCSYSQYSHQFGLCTSAPRLLRSRRLNVRETVGVHTMSWWDQDNESPQAAGAGPTQPWRDGGEILDGRGHS